MSRLFYYHYEVTAENENGTYKTARFDIRAASCALANTEVMRLAQKRFPESEGFRSWDAVPARVGA